MDCRSGIEIHKLGLSVRAINCLRRGRNFTIEKLEKTGDKDLMKIRNMGEKTLEEIHRQLERYHARVAAGEAEPPMGEAEAARVEHQQGAEAMRQDVLYVLKSMAIRTNGISGAVLRAACKEIEKLEVR